MPAMDAPILLPLLAGGIDYAGLFPPAALDLPTAVANYAAYEAGPDAWALGRFVLPAARLPELEEAAESLAPRRPSAPWRLSVLVGPMADAEIRALGEFNCAHAADSAAALVVDVVEARADAPAAIDRLLGAVPDWLQAYVEVPLDPDPAPLVAAIARHGGRAKMRTGGIIPDAVPPADLVVRFIRACTELGVPFKATAGLHHPLRGEYPMTYAPDSPRGTMFGYLNLFLAAAFVRAGMPDADARRLLEERSADALVMTPDAIEWRGRRLRKADVNAARAEGIAAFGSCSFTEPMDELRRLP